MKIGISTACFYPMETEKALKLLIDSKVKLFEVFLNSFSEMEDDFINKINNLVKDNGCKVKSIHPFAGSFEAFMLFSDYKRRFYDGLKFYEKYFYTAKKMGAEIMVLHGDNSFKTTRISDEEYFERFLILSRCAKKYNVILAQENVNCFRSESLKFIAKMKNCLKDNVNFVLDIKQAIRAGENPFEMCEAMGKNLVHIHLNDNTNDEACILPFKGSMDYKKLLLYLNKISFKGDVIIEVYNNNFSSVKELVDSYNNAKNYFK